MKSILPAKTAKLTGIETEGELAGEVVCPTIFLWKLNRQGERVRVRSKLPHDTAVTVDKTTTNGMGNVLFHIRKADSRGVHGWVTERFLIFG